MSSIDRRAPLAALADVGFVSLFAAIGRRNHDEQSGVAGFFDTATPFLVALVLGWLAVRAWRRPVDVRTGLALWAVVVIGGMMIRRNGGDGTALAFVIVAAIFVGVTLVGWRALLAALQTSRRTRHHTLDSSKA